MSQDKSTTTRLDSPHSPGLTFKKEETASRARLALTVCGLLLTLLLAALDQTIVGTARPRIIADLGSFDHYTWVTTAYLATSTVAAPVAGKLSDQLGRNRLLLGRM